MPTAMAKRKSRKPAPARGKTSSLTGLAYGAIKAEILSNRLHAGDPVPVERFTRQLRLSRTPVREAVLQLAREGLIDIRPRMGTFVSHLDLRQIQEMYAVRSLLEGQAARLAADRIPVEELAAVERQLQVQETGAGLDCRAMSEAGQGLHRLIIHWSGNRVLAQMILSLQDHFARFRTLSLEIPEKILSSHREHLEILSALKERNGEAAQTRLQRHLDHAGRHLIESLLGRSAGGAGPPVTVAAEDSAWSGNRLGPPF